MNTTQLSTPSDTTMTKDSTVIYWAEIIRNDYQVSVEHAQHAINGYIQTGKDLILAKERLPHGDFEKMIKNELPFSRQTAFKLMKISRHPSISNVTPGQHLPSGWTVLFELAKLSEADFDDAVEKGLITPDTRKRSAKATAGAYGDTGEVVGAGKDPRELPTPTEARKIARATKKFVIASDGNMYTGATKEQGEKAKKMMREVYGVIDAIAHIDELPSPHELMQHHPHLFVRMNVSQLEHGAKYLSELATEYKAKKGIIDGK